MVDLDDRDLEILGILIEDGRRSYTDIGEAVGVSGPTVSDRVDRLVERGVIRRFTVDVDRESLVEGVAVLIDLSVEPGAGEAVMDGLSAVGGVEHVVRTADDRVVAVARIDPGRVREALAGRVDFDLVDRWDVDLLEAVRWSPRLDPEGFALECAECGNTVTAEGTTATLGGERYHFCCPSCADRFTERYEELSGHA